MTFPVFDSDAARARWHHHWRALFAAFWCVATLAQTPAHAQGYLLVARPELTDANFIQTVVLAVPTEEGVTIGFVLNRPLEVSLAQMLPEHPHLARFTEPLRQGGPVNPTGLFALYRGARPQGPTEQAAEGLYMVIEKVAVEEVMAQPPTAVRFYSGYAGWAPGQLEDEIEQGAWWVLDLDLEAVHREDPSGLWEEMVARARRVTARSNGAGRPEQALRTARTAHVAEAFRGRSALRAGAPHAAADP